MRGKRGLLLVHKRRLSDWSIVILDGQQTTDRVDTIVNVNKGAPREQRLSFIPVIVYN